MIQEMDQAILALQAAAGARRHYGIDHASAVRQTAVASELLAALFAARRGLRVVLLDGMLLFDDAQLPSNARLGDLLIPRLTRHGVEWVEFQSGLSRAELADFLAQLESAPSHGGLVGTPHVRVGRIGRHGAGASSFTGTAGVPIGSPDGSGPANEIASFDSAEQIAQFKEIWKALHHAAGSNRGFGGGGSGSGSGGGSGSGSGSGGGGSGSGGGAKRPDSRLSELVESIRLAVAVGSDVCRQLADVKNHDEYTFVHTVNVAILSAALGEAVGMKGDQVFDLTMAALLHDVGKQRTPLEILNKPGKLDTDERKKMERHTVDGAAILLSRPNMPDYAPIVAFEHHANLDGTGYPDLRRNKRPHLASQIVHVADVFDALRTHRPYRAAMDPEKVRAILLESAGKSFDASLVNLFLERVVKFVPVPAAAAPAQPSAPHDPAPAGAPTSTSATAPTKAA